ncbi:hypothetical protein [Rhizohabitans arisaemae]|uniref:hypothetical protein n=1 Tax=Rhizohabitans arisaemae TaxID=2720610 RepID=UPI0024B198E9|nr:hypothetical protein [Rhizohabitans arisaemae]
MELKTVPLRRIAALALATVTAGTLIATPAAASTAEAGTKSLHFRKGLTLTVPKSWKAYNLGHDQVQIVTGSCTRTGYDESGCDSFWVMGPKQIQIGNELLAPYTPDEAFYTSTGVVSCPFDKNSSFGGSFELAGKGLRQIGPGHKAHYRNWKTQCDSGKVKRFYQREWYLPKSQILILDQWNTPGLPTILRNATWN